VLWDNKVLQQPEKFDEFLPFIRMLNAKAAYAQGRKLVDHNFVDLLNAGLKQVETAETLHTFKLFMEAFMGFYKQERPN
jgi:CRISPR-associated protein Csm2